MARTTASELARILAAKAKSRTASPADIKTTTAPECERVLSIDPALRNTGWAIIEKRGRDLKALAFGVISNPTKLLHSGCLVAIREQLNDVIKEHRPTVCAIESTIYVQSFKPPSFSAQHARPVSSLRLSMGSRFMNMRHAR